MKANKKVRIDSKREGGRENVGEKDGRERGRKKKHKGGKKKGEGKEGRMEEKKARRKKEILGECTDGKIQSNPFLRKSALISWRE